MGHIPSYIPSHILSPAPQHRTAQLQRHVADIAELHFIDAPHLLRLYYKPQPDTPPPDALPTPKYAWFHTPEQQLGDPKNPQQWEVAPEGLDAQQHDRQTEGWRACWDMLAPLVRDVYDGVLGFSQGAAVAAALAAMVSDDNDMTGKYKCRFVICCSGYIPVAVEASDMLVGRDTPIRMPTLHVYAGSHNNGDRQVMTEASRALCACFAEDTRVCVEHAQGHLVPRESLDDVREFLMRMMTC